MLDFNRISFQIDNVSTDDNDSHQSQENTNTPDDNTGSNNAPVTRVCWACLNLPDGLSLSTSGLLDGHPTSAGSFVADFSVSTNWGTTNKSIRIVIQ